MEVIMLDTFDEMDDGRTLAEFLLKYEEMETWELDALEELGLEVW